MQTISIKISDLLTVFGFFIGALLFLAGIIGWFVQNLHSQLKKSIDNIHLDLKPLVVKVAVHEEKINEIKEDQKEIHKWINHYDGRMQHVERKVASIKQA